MHHETHADMRTNQKTPNNAIHQIHQIHQILPLPSPPPVLDMNIHDAHSPDLRCSSSPIPNALLSGNRVENLQLEALAALRLPCSGGLAEVEFPAVIVLARSPGSLVQVSEPVGLAGVDGKVGFAYGRRVRFELERQN